MNQDVVRFDVPMHDIALRQHLKGLHHLSEKEKSPFLRERALFIHEFVHGAPVTELIDEVKVVGSFEHIDVLDYVRAVLQ